MRQTGTGAEAGPEVKLTVRLAGAIAFTSP